MWQRESEALPTGVFVQGFAHSPTSLGELSRQCTATHTPAGLWGWAAQPDARPPLQVCWSGPVTCPRGLTVNDDGWRWSINAAVSSGKDVIAVPCPAASVSFSAHVVVHVAMEMAGDKCCSKYVRGSASCGSSLLFWYRAAIVKMGEVIITKFAVLRSWWCTALLRFDGRAWAVLILFPPARRVCKIGLCCLVPCEQERLGAADGMESGV